MIWLHQSWSRRPTKAKQKSVGTKIEMWVVVKLEEKKRMAVGGEIRCMNGGWIEWNLTSPLDSE